ncbi:SusC/RagA family TonB-linked outer membrane protein [Alistipes sp. ZOR0009]|uniref:SusC/RagA family TonB-linked outer membrane protein n=1 Tax=Alistipes sp. ZOR0009 TaxID=1339253 RepID=UPI0009DCDA5B|nr:TonB-dependent receptor [Alistipes sp. ZOR0009]
METNLFLRIAKLKNKGWCTLFLVLGLVFLQLSSFGQTGTVTGTVKDDDKTPTPGVNVTIKGTTTGAATDVNGKYAIKAASTDVLVFSFIGMQTIEVSVGNRKVVDVILKSETKKLNELVVIGYGSVQKKDVTTAVSTVSAKEIADRPIVSAAQALQGKSAGVQVVQPSGKPGVGLSIRVRGSTSVVASNEPLYVVDGIPTDGVSNLSPNDIENMVILKDASSASIYGARAANGVVLITTKRGKSGKALLSFNAYTGVSKIGKTIDVLNTEQYRQLLKDIGGANQVPDGISTYTNWNDETFKTGTIQSYQLSASAGREGYSYYVSGGYQEEKGIVAPASFKRYTFRANMDNQLKEWVKLTTNFSMSRAQNMNAADNAGSGRGGVILSVLNTPPFLSVWDSKNPKQYAANPFQPSWENPLAQSAAKDQNTDSKIQGSAALEFSLLKDLKYKTTLGVDYNVHNWDYYLDPVRTNWGRKNNGLGKADRSSSTVWLWENLLTYSKSFNKLNFNGILGSSTQSSRWDHAYMEGKDYPANIPIETLNIANLIDPYSASTSASEWSVLSYFARASFNYDNKYLLTANFRADGTSKMPSNNRWGYFPSFSAGWRVSSERFMESIASVVNDLKLRVGWGETGNQEGIGDYYYYGTYGITRRPITDPYSGPLLWRQRMNNPDLKWETTTQSNVGVDVSFLNSRITLNMDAYYKKTTDLLFDVVFPSTVGLGALRRNNGEVENKGFEFNITSQNLKGALGWTTDFNMSFNRNKVTKLGLTKNYLYGGIESNGQSIILLKEGVSLGTFYGYISEGVNPETGDIIYKDLNSNGKIDPDDRTIIGNAQPDFIFGMTNSFTWKNFNLNFFIQGSYGNDIFNATRIDTEGMFDVKNQSTEVLRRWKRPGMVTDIPRAGNIYNSNNSTRFVEDGSYVRLKSVTLGYMLQGRWMGKVGINKLNIYVTGQNLLTLTNYSGYDPEVNMGGGSSTVLGVDYGTYPQSKSVVAGVNIEF